MSKIITVSNEVGERFNTLLPPDMKSHEFVTMLLDGYETRDKDIQTRQVLMPEEYWMIFRQNVAQAILDAAEVLFKEEETKKTEGVKKMPGNLAIHEPEKKKRGWFGR